MGIEGRDLIGVGLRNTHFLAQGAQMPSRDIMVAVLDQMQELDEKIPAARPIAEQRAHLLESLEIELTPLGEGPRALALAIMPRRPVGGASVAPDALIHATCALLDWFGSSFDAALIGSLSARRSTAGSRKAVLVIQRLAATGK